jgi:CubicO group peptidase (beta-lactamase class C family)
VWGLLCVTTATFRGFSSSVDETVSVEMKNHGIPGVSVAIIQNGRLSTAKGYGFTDKGKTTAVTTNTLFQAGSISKPVAALAALRFVEEGRFTLDDDVNQFLKRWQVRENAFTKDQKVTLRRILSHSAGLTVHGFPGYDAHSRLPSLREVLDGSKSANTAAIRVDVVPGSTSRYSGGGYTVMQQMMLDVTGKTFPDLMRENVLTPLQMNASTYEQPLPADRATCAAAGHDAKGKGIKRRWHVYPEMAAAGLWTTPSDLARFAIGIQEAFVGKSNPVISRTMTRQMLTVQIGSYGLGLGLEGSGDTLRFHHGGRNAGFDALLLACGESGAGVVIMINANDYSGAVKRIADAVSKEHHWPSADKAE